jgi:hypothetical protein
MPEEQSEKLRRLFEELRQAEAAAGAQARQADERKRHYLFAACIIIFVILFTLGMILIFIRAK